MEPFAAIAAGLTAIDGATKTVKLVMGAEKAFSQAELKLELVEVMSALADAKEQVLDARSALQEKDIEITELRKALERKADLIHVRDVYYEKDADGNPTGSPHCSRCFEVDGLAIHIVSVPGKGNSMACPKCKHVYLKHLRFGPDSDTTEEDELNKSVFVVPLTR